MSRQLKIWLGLVSLGVGNFIAFLWVTLLVVLPTTDYLITHPMGWWILWYFLTLVSTLALILSGTSLPSLNPKPSDPNKQP